MDDMHELSSTRLLTSLEGSPFVSVRFTNFSKPTRSIDDHARGIDLAVLQQIDYTCAVLCLIEFLGFRFRPIKAFFKGGFRLELATIASHS